MITEQDKRETLNRILKSKTFSKSTTANVLLKYLVDMSIDDREITAADIGHELFGSRYEQEKSEATVRVNIYHLRKKLNKYFDDEGYNDSITIHIDRGQYKVSFHEKKLQHAKNKKWRNAIAISAFIGIIMVSIFLLLKNSHHDKIWNSLFKNKFQTILFLSPIYGYVGPAPTGEFIFHRDSRINSDQQLQNTLDSLHISSDLYKPDRPYYVAFEDAATLNHFSKLFTTHNSNFMVRKATDFHVSDVKDQNIIYLGPMRYRTSFSDVFNEFSTNVDLVETSSKSMVLHYVKSNLQVDTTFLITSDYRTYEYAIAAKFKGSNNTSHIMFFADHGLGLTAMAEYFTKEDSIHSFSKKYLQQSDEFVAFFYVSGKDRTNLDLKLILFDDNK